MGFFLEKTKSLKEENVYFFKYKVFLSVIFLTFHLGFYACINTSVPHNPGDRAMMTSSAQRPSAVNQCLTFWYFMSGRYVDQLNTYIISNGVHQLSSIFNMLEQHWVEVAINLQPQTTQWQVNFILWLHWWVVFFLFFAYCLSSFSPFSSFVLH